MKKKPYFLSKIFVGLSMAVMFSLGYLWTNYHNISRIETNFANLGFSWDNMIPFVPGFVWVYLLYYPLCFAPLLLIKQKGIFRRVASAYSMEFFVSFVVFYLLPAQMERPVITGTDLSSLILNRIYAMDPGFNICPSLHVANLVLVCLIFYHFGRFRAGNLLMAATVLVSLSTLFVKQHYLLDILCGSALAFLSYWLCFQAPKFFLRRRWSDKLTFTEQKC